MHNYYLLASAAKNVDDKNYRTITCNIETLIELMEVHKLNAYLIKEGKSGPILKKVSFGEKMKTVKVRILTAGGVEL